MQKKLCIIFIVCIFSSIHQIIASSAIPGTLDTTFNAAGVQPGTVSTNIGNLTNQNAGQAVAIQTDGKIVVAGFAQVGVGGHTQFAVARFKKDGTIDPSFNSGGVEPGTTFTTIEGVNLGAEGKGVAIQSDGKIVVAGFTSAGGGKFAVARFNTDGTLDPTFNPSPAPQPGTVSTQVDNGSAQGQAVAIQSDGKIVVAGIGGGGFGVARFTTGGILDPTFNGGVQAGTASTSIDNIVSAQGHAVAIQSDGKIVVAGRVLEAGAFKFAVARFNTDGTLDATGFNSSGIQHGTVSTFVDGGASATGEAVAIQTDGKIVVAGFSFDAFGNENFGVARFLSSGTLDPSFNQFGTQPGTASTPIDNIGNTSNEAYGVAIQTNGKIVLVGTVFDTGELGVARYNTDGTLDTTFNPAGNLAGTVSITIDNSQNDDEARGVAIQTDGKIVVGGFTGDNTNSRFAAARFNGDPPPIPPLPTTNQCAIRFITKYGPRL
jgi:uncharacterized delta-60 repeat protein